MGRSTTRREGFTLIELIAVIIILGILAAVITPKYFSVTEKAAEANLKGAANEAAARFHLAYAKYSVDHQAPASGLSVLATDEYLGTDLSDVNLGDFSASYTGGSGDPVSDVQLTVTDAAGETYSTALPWP